MFWLNKFWVCVILSITSEDKQVDNDHGRWLRGLLKWWRFSELFNTRNILWRNQEENKIEEIKAIFTCFKMYFCSCYLFLFLYAFFPFSFLFYFSSPILLPSSFPVFNWALTVSGSISGWGWTWGEYYKHT